MSKHLLMILLITAAVAVGCQNNKVGEVENPQPLKNPSFARQWATDLEHGGDDPVTAIHVTDQFVFAYRKGGTSDVMDRATGKLLHIDQPRGSREKMHPPVVLKDRIVYPTTTYLEVFDLEGHYVAHAVRLGDEMDKPFSQELRTPIESDAVGSGKFLFFGAGFPGGGRAVAVDMTRPYVPDFWTLMEPGAIVAAAPAVSKDVVYVAATSGTVAAVAIDGRLPLWTLPNLVFGTYAGITGNLAVDDSNLYVASTDTKLYCLLKSTGKIRWQYFGGSPLHDGPVVMKDLVYQYIPDNGVVAIDKAAANAAQTPTYNREPRWTAGDGRQFAGSDDRYAYIRTNANLLLAIDKKTGQPMFQSQRTDLTAFGTSTKGDGMLYVASENGRVMAVKPVVQPGQVGEVVMAPVGPESIANCKMPIAKVKLARGE